MESMGQRTIFRKDKTMIIPRKEIEDIAAGPEGYSRIKVEQVCGMLRILKRIQEEDELRDRLALKGGTAINLLTRMYRRDEREDEYVCEFVDGNYIPELIFGETDYFLLTRMKGCSYLYETARELLKRKEEIKERRRQLIKKATKKMKY